MLLDETPTAMRPPLSNSFEPMFFMSLIVGMFEVLTEEIYYYSMA